MLKELKEVQSLLFPSSLDYHELDDWEPPQTKTDGVTGSTVSMWLLKSCLSVTWYCFSLTCVSEAFFKQSSQSASASVAGSSLTCHFFVFPDVVQLFFLLELPIRFFFFWTEETFSLSDQMSSRRKPVNAAAFLLKYLQEVTAHLAQQLTWRIERPLLVAAHLITPCLLLLMLFVSL